MGPKAAPTIDPTTILVNGKPVFKITRTIRALAPLPILNAVAMRPNRTFRGGESNANNEEAWLAQERGEAAPRACDYCRMKNPSGPFDTCMILEGHLKGSCPNCHYGGSGSRCSLRDDLENALAQIEANEKEAPKIPDMAPANYTGGSLKNAGGFSVTVIIEKDAATVNPAATPGVTRGGGKKGKTHIAPTPVDRNTGQPLLGPFGTTIESGIEYARTLSAEQRKKGIERAQREMAALVFVENEQQEDDEENDEEDMTENSEKLEEINKESEEEDEEPKAKRQKRSRDGAEI